MESLLMSVIIIKNNSDNNNRTANGQFVFRFPDKLLKIERFKIYRTDRLAAKLDCRCPRVRCVLWFFCVHRGGVSELCQCYRRCRCCRGRSDCRRCRVRCPGRRRWSHSRCCYEALDSAVAYRPCGVWRRGPKACKGATRPDSGPELPGGWPVTTAALPVPGPVNKQKIINK